MLNRLGNSINMFSGHVATICLITGPWLPCQSVPIVLVGQCEICMPWPRSAHLQACLSSGGGSRPLLHRLSIAAMQGQIEASWLKNNKQEHMEVHWHCYRIVLKAQNTSHEWTCLWLHQHLQARIVHQTDSRCAQLADNMQVKGYQSILALTRNPHRCKAISEGLLSRSLIWDMSHTSAMGKADTPYMTLDVLSPLPLEAPVARHEARLWTLRCCRALQELPAILDPMSCNGWAYSNECNHELSKVMQQSILRSCSHAMTLQSRNWCICAKAP